MNTFDTSDLQARDSAHYLHPFTDSKALATRGARVIVRADDIYVWDSEGKRMLDAMSGLWCVAVGYGRRRLADAAHRQMLALPFYNSFFKTSVVPAIDLATRLAKLAPPGFSKVFFTNSGSEGNDTVIRMVRRYWDLQGQPERKVIISRINGYHGSTMGGASLSGMDYMHAQGGLPIPDIVHIGQPYWYGSDRSLTPEAFGVKAAGWLEEKILALGPERVAAFIAEPVQGAGGVIIPPASYWPEIQRIVDKYGILLVSDEVICGFGRLGQWFGCQLFGTRPDLITFAKAVTSGYIPLGGVLVGDRVAHALTEHGADFNHGFTYSGHPTACAVALENLDIMEEEDLLRHVREDVGPYLKLQFDALIDHPLVGIAEACGLVAGLALVQDKSSGTAFDPDLEVGMICRDICFSNGLVMRAVGDRMIIAPPLIITRGQIDELIALIRQCLDQTWAEAKARGWISN
jgi:putrescine aminotransferase